ncbi:MAG: hypothetical protein SVR94_03205, partial [Pseudomonadota bacterium]|nr:hypothetical protein [Pseudomonadota bacterium]
GRTGPSGRDCISPAIGPECTLPTEGINAFGFELTFVSIKDIKNMLGSSDDDFLSGRVVIEFPQQYNTPMGSYRHLSWPGLMYTFEWDKAASLSHWRPMHRMHPVTMP